MWGIMGNSCLCLYAVILFKYVKNKKAYCFLNTQKNLKKKNSNLVRYNTESPQKKHIS